MIVIISRYNEDVSWLEEYNFDYIIYNKGNELDKKYNHIKDRKSVV